MHQLQLVPSHNSNAGRPLPLPKLGRRELATWWWQSCTTCWGKTPKKRRALCCNCQRLARSVKCLSKTTWKIDKQGKLTVTASKKNRHLLWWNARQIMMKTTSLQLQVGDVISVGNNAETPWLEFTIQKRKAPVVVTPETNNGAKMPSKISSTVARASARRTLTNRKSRRRLFSGHHHHHHRDRHQSEESSSDETENNQVFSTIHETEMDYTNAVMARRDADTSEDESHDSWYPATKKRTRAHERNTMSSSRRKLLSTQDEHLSLLATSRTTEETRHKQTQAPIIIDNNHHDESQESSVLSLPVCPTWEEESQHHVGTNSIYSPTTTNSSVQKPCSHEDAQQQEQHSSNESKATTTDESSSQGRPNVTFKFASMLSLSQWKQLRQDNDDGATGIRGALASLVVVQRVRDPTWFPAILEGAVVEDVCN